MQLKLYKVSFKQESPIDLLGHADCAPRAVSQMTVHIIIVIAFTRQGSVGFALESTNSN